MFRNYFVTAFRNIFKHKVYSFLNVTGLALGLACSIFILLWVQDELNYDRHFEGVENLYRVEEDQYYGGESYHVNVTPFPCAPVFKSDIPEVEDAARITWHSVLLRDGEKAFYENSIVAADPSYFDMFKFDFVLGDPTKVLDDPSSIILDEELAEKYFGNENPIGKTLTLNNKFDFRVTGVFKKLPNNTSFSFQGAFQFEFLKELDRWSEHWGSNSIFTFVKLTPNSNLDLVNQKLTKLVKDHNEDSTTDFMVAPVTGLHLYSYWGYGKPAGAIQYVYIFTVIAFFVLIIACINFMNLATARSSSRAKEIGMRKVVGAVRGNLITQFFGESIILAFLGMGIAMIMVALLLPASNDLTGKDIQFSIFYNFQFIIGLVSITLFTGVIAGFYPALFLSSFRPVKILKGSLKVGAKNSVFRKVLVVFQFSLSVFLIVGTIVIYNQLTFMQSKGLGYDKEHMIYVSMRGEVVQNYEAIVNELRNTQGVLNVTGSGHTPHRIGSNSGGAEWDGKDPEQTVLIGTNVIDYNFTETMKIEMAAGRDFSREFSMDLGTDSTGNFLVNEEVAKVMGKTNEEAVGERFDFMGIEGKIVGVMKNFHYSSIKNKIEPLAMVLYPEGIGYIVIRIASGDITNTLDNVKESWASVVPEYPLKYRFFDEDFERMYRAEERMVELLKYFSIMAIIIACLGLFGLASFTAEQRKKEIGIRKVLGATEYKLTYLLCREFIVLVLVSMIVAWPAAYLALGGWLESFAYRIELNLITFLFSGIITMVIALATVGYQAIRASIANPIVALKYE